MADDETGDQPELIRDHLRWAQGRATARGVPPRAGQNFERYYNRTLPRVLPGGRSGLFLQPGGRHTPTRHDK